MTGFWDSRTVAIETEPVAPELLIAGSPRTGTAALGEFAGVEFGVWEMTPGAMRDVEVDETFVVVHGRGTVLIDGETVVLEPGVVGRLVAGTETVWTVSETIRKVYHS